MSSRDDSPPTFDELLTQLIEALGELANQHVNEVQALSLESARLRTQLVEVGTARRDFIGAKADESRTYYCSDEAVACSRFVEADPFADTILNEHGSLDNDTDAVKEQLKLPLSPAFTEGDVRTSEVAIELEDDRGSPSETEKSVDRASDKGMQPEWAVLKGVSNFQLRKLWSDRMEFDRFKLSNVEACLLKEARWVKKEGLPENEGTTLFPEDRNRNDMRTDFKTLQAMRKACQSFPDCVGFAYWPDKGWCFPKKVGTGFDPDTAVYTQKRKNEVWEWHYMPSRAQLIKQRGRSQLGLGSDEEDSVTHSHRRNSGIVGSCGGFEGIVVHPRSRWRAVWLSISMLLLLYDLFMVPVTLCFNIEAATFENTMQLVAAIFWSLDIPVTFCTGIFVEKGLEMRLRYTARAYARSWFVFDLLLVIQEWAELAVSQETLRSVSIARAVRWARLMRLLRMVRVVRVSKLQPMMRYFFYEYNLDKHGVALFGMWLGITVILFLLVHLIACFWHAVAAAENGDGWIEVNHLDSGNVPRKYSLSLRWTLARLHGMASDYRLQSTAEIILDSLLIFLSLLFASVYAGQVNALSSAWASSRMSSSRKLAHKYFFRHQISVQLQKRVQLFLRAAHYGGAVQMKEDEESLLAELPRFLQEDLLFEARMCFIRIKLLFEDMYWLSPRAVQHLCKGAFNVVIAMDLETIFECSESTGRMLFVTSGSCWYTCDESILQATQRPWIRHADSIPGSEFIVKGNALAEPVLWTDWVHTGTLTANEETMLLGLDAKEFGNIVLQHIEACMHAVKYGKRFIWYFNRCEPSDLVDFAALRLDYLDQDFLDGSEDRHFVFISHYKLEAGTEATLMRDALEQILKEDPGNQANYFHNPVFVDSENLEDLTTLKGHVERSQAILLLLTPGLLSRPWCLVEIATAVAAGIKVVLVAIQSPLFKYKYPDEKFYARLRAGEILDADANALLHSEGFELGDVEHVIREVHKKIAMPFSPHKSKNVRHAELEDIIRRCGPPESAQASSSPGRSSGSKQSAVRASRESFHDAFAGTQSQGTSISTLTSRLSQTGFHSQSPLSRQTS